MNFGGNGRVEINHPGLQFRMPIGMLVKDHPSLNSSNSRRGKYGYSINH
jgi:hypothetical protein